MFYEDMFHIIIVFSELSSFTNTTMFVFVCMSDYSYINVNDKWGM